MIEGIGRLFDLFPSTIFLTIWLICLIVLFCTIIIGGYFDIKTRYIHPVYFHPFWILAFLPGIYIMVVLILNGWVMLVAANIVMICWVYIIGLQGVIGGSDARVLMCVGWIIPVLFPMLFVFLFSYAGVKVFYYISPKLRIRKDTRGIPMVAFMAFGFPCSVVLTFILLTLL